MFTIKWKERLQNGNKNKELQSLLSYLRTIYQILQKKNFLFFLIFFLQIRHNLHILD